jgi:hypothetical protein
MFRRSRTTRAVMPALVAGIHVLLHQQETKAWMAGTSPAMTKSVIQSDKNLL